jgi:hypothetical protein
LKLLKNSNRTLLYRNPALQGGVFVFCHSVFILAIPNQISYTMKNVVCLISIFLCLFVLQANAATPSFAFGSKHAPSQVRIKAMQASHSILVKKYERPQYGTTALAAYDCGKYKRIQTAGIVLLSVGGATFIGSVAMIAVGVGNAYNNGSDYLSAGLIGGGAVGTVLGVGMMGAGTALTIVGSVKLKKYCGNSTSSTRNFYLSPTTAHGLGFAARF